MKWKVVYIHHIIGDNFQIDSRTVSNTKYSMALEQVDINVQGESTLFHIDI